jgi:hypothetical protein
LEKTFNGTEKNNISIKENTFCAGGGGGQGVLMFSHSEEDVLIGTWSPKDALIGRG